jgi:hypothetical protein
MELFAAGDQSQMEVIRRWIDESDIFMLILGARYGSIEPQSGLSYVELEYNYAIEKGKPFFSIVLTEEGKKAKVQSEGIGVLENQNEAAYRRFHERVMSKLCEQFTNAQDVKVAVLKTLPKIIESHPELVGWLSAAEVDVSLPEILKEFEVLIHDLKTENAYLKHERQELQQKQVDNTSLRINLRKQVGTLNNSLTDLNQIIDQARISRRAILGARGLSRSGAMDASEKGFQKDIEELFSIKKQVPHNNETFESLDSKALENKIVDIHNLQKRGDSLQEKQRASIHSDDESRKQIAELYNRPSRLT